jgi:hypothetical protein
MGLDHSVHALIATHNGVHRACSNAQGAAYAPVFVDKSQRARTLGTEVGVNGLDGAPRDRGKPCHAFGTTRWALVDVSLPNDNCPGVAQAVGIAAALALRLG